MPCTGPIRDSIAAVPQEVVGMGIFERQLGRKPPSNLIILCL